MFEKDVELAFANWLNERRYHVLAHQVRLPLGTLDILAYLETPAEVIPVVAEIKLGTINEKACTQLLGYMEQVERILEYNSKVDPAPDMLPVEQCRGVLVGASLNPMCARVVAMMKMDFCRYDVVDGEIRFELQEAYGETPADRYKPVGAMNTLFVLRERKKAKIRVNNAGALGSYENFHAVTTGENVPHLYESLSATLPYWRRRR